MDITAIINFTQSIIVFLLTLSVLVLIHEFGHFVMARRAGIKVEEFGLGFPPRVWSKKRGETVYSLNAIPIGGFVRLYGEDETVDKDHERAFFHKSKLTRISILVAGVVMNFLLGVIIFAIISWFNGIAQPSGQIKITDIAPNSPALESGMKVSDVIISVDGESVHEGQQLIADINKHKGQETIFTIFRQGSGNFNLKATPRENPPQGEGALGLAFSDMEIVYPPLSQRPFVSLREGFKEAIYVVQATFDGLVGAAKQAFQFKKPEGLAGPIGIFQLTEKTRELGIFSLLSFIAILSINLSLLNILPIPALDGGRLLFILLESVFGLRWPTFEKYAHTIGMIVLLTLMLLITLSDVQRVLTGGSLLPQ